MTVTRYTKGAAFHECPRPTFKPISHKEIALTRMPLDIAVSIARRAVEVRWSGDNGTRRSRSS